MKRMIIIVAMTIMLTGCSAQQDKIEYATDMYLEDGFEYINDGNRIDEIRNIYTGVHYYMIRAGSISGLSPVYNSDGSVKITD